MNANVYNEMVVYQTIKFVLNLENRGSAAVRVVKALRDTNKYHIYKFFV